MPKWLPNWTPKNPEVFNLRPQKTAWKEFQELYPVGALVKTLIKIDDPFKKEGLLPGSLVVIKKVDIAMLSPDSFQMSKTAKVWILCEDQNKELWNIRPHHLEKYKGLTGKKGRFRILAQDAELERHNHNNKGIL